MPTLRLKYQEKVQEGQGEFLTFESIRQPSPSTAITCPWTRTVASLGSIFGYEALDLEAAPLGPWMRLEWPSSDTCLELASQYVLEGVVVFQHSHSPPSVQNVNKIGSSALRSLQISVGSCGQDKDKEILLMAVMLHFAAEVRVISMSILGPSTDFLEIRSSLAWPHGDLYHMYKEFANCSSHSKFNPAGLFFRV